MMMGVLLEIRLLGRRILFEMIVVAADVVVDFQFDHLHDEIRSNVQ